jgi:hypothetical protein
MNRQQLFTTVLIGTFTLGVPLSTLAGDTPPNFSAKNEVELANITPSVKNVSIQLKGTEREKNELETIRAIVQKILDSSKLGVVSLPVPDASSLTPDSMTVENLEIVISVKSPAEENQPYEVGLTLQEEDGQGTPEYFEFWPTKPEKIAHELKDYLTETLQLQPKPVSRPISQSPQFPPIYRTPTPSQPVHSAPPLPPVKKEVSQPIASDTSDEPQNISAKKEYQLKSLTPTVKSFSIKLRGTEREKAELDVVYTMVNNIIRSSKLGVVRVPVSGEPVTTPIIKVYENLEIVVSMKSPEEETQPFQVGIALQEQGTQGEPQPFDYYPEKRDIFFNQLKAFLTERLDLKPR